MSSFGGESLFDSGPHRFLVGGLSLRHTLHDAIGGAGVGLSPQGHRAREITQTGELLGDSRDALHDLMVGIEGKLDGQARQLVDELGRTWRDTVMLRFDSGPMARLGPRFRVAYKIEYLQLTP